MPHSQVDRKPVTAIAMKRANSLHLGVALLFIFFVFAEAAAATTNAPPSGASGISSHDAVIDGLKLHYLQEGHGPAVILLHGYTQTSRMWRPIIPLLATKFTVIAPDLPGITFDRMNRSKHAGQCIAIVRILFQPHQFPIQAVQVFVTLD